MPNKKIPAEALSINKDWRMMDNKRSVASRSDHSYAENAPYSCARITGPAWHVNVSFAAKHVMSTEPSKCSV